MRGIKGGNGMCQCKRKPEASCKANYIELNDGLIKERLRHREDRPCGDCGVSKNGYHHMGCDLERCPVCGMQLITCECLVSFQEVKSK